MIEYANVVFPLHGLPIIQYSFNLPLLKPSARAFIVDSIHVIKAIVEKELEVVLKKATNL